MSAAAICGLTAFGAVARGLAKAPPIIMPAEEHRHNRCNHDAVAARRDMKIAQLFVQKLLILRVHPKISLLLQCR